MPIDRFANEVPRHGDFLGDVVAMQREDHPNLARTVLSTLVRERAGLIEQLASVRAKDYAEYLGRFSQIDGLNIAISHIKEAAKKLG